MATGKVKALWVGPYEAQTPDGTLLIPGETRYPVDPAELASDHWQADQAKPPEAPKPVGGEQ